MLQADAARLAFEGGRYSLPATKAAAAAESSEPVLPLVRLRLRLYLNGVDGKSGVSIQDVRWRRTWHRTSHPTTEPDFRHILF